jgi:hypothetical protein
MNYTIGTATTINLAWECPRCHTMNAPNTSKCDCVAAPAVNPSYPYVPWIYPQTWPPYLPYVGDPPPEPWITWTNNTGGTSTNITFGPDKDE